MTTNEYQDRLLLTILEEDKRQAGTAPFPVIDVFAAAMRAELLLDPRRIAEAVKFYEANQWITALRKSDGSIGVAIKDAGREQESRIRQAWTTSLSLRPR